MFRAFERRNQNRNLSYKKWTDQEGTLHQCWYANNFALNEDNPGIRVNVLMYEQKKKNGQVKKFSWATSIKIHWRNVEKLRKKFNASYATINISSTHKKG